MSHFDISHSGKRTDVDNKMNDGLIQFSCFGFRVLVSWSLTVMAYSDT